MVRYFFLVVLSVIASGSARSQEYKVKKSSGKLILNLPAVSVEGYNGQEIIFSSERKEAEIDPKAEGLQTINNAGYRDNTGLGISVIEKGTTVEVNEVIQDLTIKVMVPKGMILAYVYNKPARAGKVTCRNMENEIEIETYNNNILLENITGPATVRSLYGAVDATFSKPVKGPVSIASIQSTVDVAIPVDTKATLKLKSTYSTIMTSPDFKIEVEKSEEKDIPDIPRYVSLVNGKLNGGGAVFTLTSEFGKIYLRKTK